MTTLAIYRLRLLFRGAFLLLAVATLALALHVLQDEKQRSYRNYQASFQKTQQQIVAKLRHPTGQLALLNPRRDGHEVTPLRPMLLPFSAIDFDDPNKVQLAVEMSGCLVQYPQGGLCVAIGNNPWAGGFIYAAGSFSSGELVPHAHGDIDLSQAHRLRVEVAIRGQTYRWLAPFEVLESARSTNQGRLTGFVDDGSQRSAARPVKEFRGWIWQEGHCAQIDAKPPCERRVFFSLRLPVEVLRDALFQQKQRVVWPPADLQQILVHLQALPPGDGPPLFDSNSTDAVAPMALGDLMPLLLPGESLRIRKVGAATDLLQMIGAATEHEISPLLVRLIRALPVGEPFAAPEVVEEIRTPVGNYQATFTGNGRSIDRSLDQFATQLAWLAGAMLLATLLAWAVIEIGIIRRIAILTRRAVAVSKGMKGTGDIDQFELQDLRGRDELGVLASCLHDLLQRVKEDVAREKIRAEQEKDMWHAVGHEIMSPLQSLMALHGNDRDNPSVRYINRMQQAIRVLYGSASPSEALQSTTLEIQSIDLDAFLRNIADNAPCVGINDVGYASLGKPVLVRADEYSLEDVVTHILRNAERYRTPGTPITLTLRPGATVSLIVHNQGPPISAELIDRIFEYGVSDQVEAAANGNRGQGLFVAKTYMAKMGGTIVARNVADGVEFELSLGGVENH